MIRMVVIINTGSGVGPPSGFRWIVHAIVEQGISNTMVLFSASTPSSQLTSLSVNGINIAATTAESIQFLAPGFVMIAGDLLKTTTNNTPLPIIIVDEEPL